MHLLFLKHKNYSEENGQRISNDPQIKQKRVSFYLIH